MTSDFVSPTIKTKRSRDEDGSAKDDDEDCSPLLKTPRRVLSSERYCD